ncbi:MAG: universal stress protein [Actinobacteria bacterium]|nr:MAG: universal stress protein [Actinomycetota bacterium]
MAYKKILVGTDGSPPSLMSVREAARLAKAFGSELVVVCAYEPVDQATVERWKEDAPTDIGWRFTATSGAETAAEKGREAAGELGVVPRAVIEEGEAGDAIIRVAEREGVDLIVVGNRGMAGPTRFLLGSVPNKVSHHAPCDLLIVKTVA